MPVGKPGNERRGVALVAALTALGMLVAAGLAHRWLLARISASVEQQLPPAAPLATIPLEFGSWRGEDTPLDESVARVVQFDDEYLQRRYVNPSTGRSVGLFVGYVGRPRVHLGHRPDVCFAAHGMEQTAASELKLPDAGRDPAAVVLYEFHSEGLVEQRVLVLAMYLINGRFSADPDSFRRYNARGAGLLGERRAYLARVQLSMNAGADRDADVAALHDLAGQLLPALRRVLPYMGEESSAP